MRPKMADMLLMPFSNHLLCEMFCVSIQNSLKWVSKRPVSNDMVFAQMFGAKPLSEEMVA